MSCPTDADLNYYELQRKCRGGMGGTKPRTSLPWQKNVIDTIFREGRSRWCKEEDWQGTRTLTFLYDGGREVQILTDLAPSTVNTDCRHAQGEGSTLTWAEGWHVSPAGWRTDVTSCYVCNTVLHSKSTRHG